MVQGTDNVIPPMTHPLSSAWDQPPLTDILIDDDVAMMSQRTLGNLADYSHSMPSGVYEGKMWCARIKEKDKEPQWHLRWYGLSTMGPNMCSNNMRPIVVVD